VNGEVITWTDVRREMGSGIAQHLGYPDPAVRAEKLSAYAYDKLRHLIEEKILLQQARAAGDITVSDEEVDRKVREKEKELGSFLDLVKVLSDRGVTISQFQKSLREDLMREKFMQANFFSTPWGTRLRRYSLIVSPKELRDYFSANRESFRRVEAVWLRRAVIPASRHGSAEAARSVAEGARKRLADGETPASVNARLDLRAEELVARVEELEPIGPESGLVAEVKTWALAAREGEVSPVFTLAPDVFAVFVVAKKQDAEQLDFEQVQKRIEERLRERKGRIAQQEMLKRIHRAADITPPDLKRWILGEVRSPPPAPPPVLEGLLGKG